VQSDFHLASAASLAKLAADVPPTQQKTATAANSVRFSGQFLSLPLANN